MAEINERTFDPTIVEGKKYRRGVLFFTYGVVKRRKAGLSEIITAY